MSRLSYPDVFPSSPYPSGSCFAAFICSYMPDDAVHASMRQGNLVRQLAWWRRMTDMPVSVIASNWQDRRLESCGELQRVQERGGQIIRTSAQPLIANRIRALQALYASDADWGTIMDDDAVLYDSPAHNSGAAFFAEMALNGTDAYREVDVFFPINPQKIGFNPIWRKEPDLYRGSHVFARNHDLKGSLFVVRNFPKFGRPPIYPPADYLLHGEDTLFAVEALAKGCTVMRCENIVLKEFSSVSHFGADRIANMRAGAERMVDLYWHQGLRLSGVKGRGHLLDRTELVRRSGRAQPQRLVVAMPDPLVTRPWAGNPRVAKARSQNRAKP